MPTTSLAAIFVFSFAVGFGAVASPGPVSTAIVSQAPRRGWLVGPLIATGHSLIEFIVVFLIAVGLASGLAGAAVQVVIALLGGLLLFWMGTGMLLDIRKGNIYLPDAEAAAGQMSDRQLVGLGMLTTLTNPFWYAWWFTVAAGYLAQVQASGLAAIAAFYLGHISADYAWDTALSAIIGGGRRWITNTHYRWIIGLCGAFFIFIAVKFLIEAYILLGKTQIP